MSVAPPTLTVSAQSVDAELWPLLAAGPRSLPVHSVFRRAVNLSWAPDRLITLVAGDLDDAPDTVVTTVSDWQPLGLQAGAEIVLKVDLSRARAWHASLPAYPADDSGLRTAVVWAEAQLQKSGRGLLLTAAPELSDFDRALRSSLQERTSRLLAGLANEDWTQAEENAIGLLGLGQGLTPSGDDFLVGLLAALNLPQSPASAARRIGSAVALAAPRLTNAISVAALRHAARGRVRHGIGQWCSALVGGTEPEWHSGLQRVLAIGSSSGTDIAVGVLAGMKVSLEYRR